MVMPILPTVLPTPPGRPARTRPPRAHPAPRPATPNPAPTGPPRLRIRIRSREVPPSKRTAPKIARVHARAELRARVERAQQPERVHLARQDREEEVEVERLRAHRRRGALRAGPRGRVGQGGGGGGGGLRVADGVDDGGDEHAGGREHGGLEGDEDDVVERAVEVAQAGARAPERDGDCDLGGRGER